MIGQINPATIGFQLGQIAISAGRAELIKGLTPRQCEILDMIPREWPGITGNGLIHITEISAGTVHPALSKLHGMGFVEKRQDGSRVMYRRVK